MAHLPQRPGEYAWRDRALDKVAARIDKGWADVARRLDLPSNVFAADCTAPVPGWDNEQLQELRNDLATRRAATLELVLHELDVPQPRPPEPPGLPGL